MAEEIKRQEIINQMLLRNDEVDNESGRQFLETLTLEELENLQELDACNKYNEK